MKRNLLKFALCAMALLPLGAWADATTSLTTKTIITFDATSGEEYSLTTGCSEATFTNYSLAYGQNRKITSISETVSGTIAGSSYSGSKYISMTSNNNLTTSEYDTKRVAGVNLNNTTYAPCIAFNTAISGKVYISVQRRGNDNGSLMFAYQTAGSSKAYKLAISTPEDFGSDTEIKEYSYDVPEATTVFIRGNAKIYAIAFVPYQSATIGSHEWASFSNNNSFAISIPDGVTAYGASGYDGTNKEIVLEPYTDVIPANTGVVLNGSAGTYKFDYTTESGSYSGSNNFMTAVTSDNTQITAGEYVLMWDNSASTVLFQRVARGSIEESTWNTIRPKLNAGQAYLSKNVLNTPASARAFTSSIEIDDDGSTTGIMNVVQNESSDEFYTLQGMRVDNPTKGVYIKNGKKVIIK